MASAAPAAETTSAFEISPMTPAIGAELSGISVAAELSENVIADIRQALLDHKVIFFPRSASVAGRAIGLCQVLWRSRNSSRYTQGSIQS